MKRLITLLIALTAVSAIQAADYGDCYRGLPFKAEMPAAPSIPDLTVSLADFGGKGDGIALNTEAFAKAVAHLSARGGGHLVVPAGVWLSGPIEMQSNIDLHLDRDAILLFSPDKSLFPIIDPDEGTASPMRRPPIYARHISNFSITGDGVIDGNGEVWRPVKRFKVSDAEWRKLERLGLVETEEGGSRVWYPTVGNPDSARLETKRARLIRVVGCSRFLIQGVVVQNSPSFHVNIVTSNNFVLDGIMVRCPWNAQNGDGIDLSSCRDALLTGCSVDCGDDALCLKSGIGDAGRRRGPCENIVIDGCTVFHGHGGFVIGSDNAGGMNNLMVRNCRFIDTDTGLRFKSGRDRGGLMTNVWVRDVVMCDIADDAILFDSYYQEKVGDAADVAPMAVTADTPIFKGFHISNVTCRDARRAIVMKGLPELPIADVTIAGCSFTARQGIVVNNATGITLADITLKLQEGEPFVSNNPKGVKITGLKVL